MDLAYWPADTSRPVLELSTGDLLREAVRDAGEQTALIEVAPPGSSSSARTDRQWTYRHPFTNARFMIDRTQLPGRGTMVSAMPLFHTAGCAMGVLGSAHQRATYVLCQLFDPALVLTAAQDHRADLLAGVARSLPRCSFPAGPKRCQVPRNCTTSAERTWRPTRHPLAGSRPRNYR